MTLEIHFHCTTFTLRKRLDSSVLYSAMQVGRGCIRFESLKVA